MDELILQIYPHGTSRFELYEDDGRSNAYRRGAYTLTPIVCAAERGRTTVRIGAPTGDPSVVPATRRYLLRLRLERPAGVAVEGAGELQDTTADVGRPGRPNARRSADHRRGHVRRLAALMSDMYSRRAR